MKPNATVSNVTYFNSPQQSHGTPNGAFNTTWFPVFTVLFGSALSLPVAVKQSSVDFWGNVKIPYYSRILSSGAAKAKDSWTQVPLGITPVYSSLFGIPLSSLKLGNTTRMIESTYVELSCNNITLIRQDTSNGRSVTTNMISPNVPFVSFTNVSVVAPWPLGYKGPVVLSFRKTDQSSYIRPQSCPDCLSEDYITTTIGSGTLLYQEFAVDENVTSVFCTPPQAYIESAVFCSKTLTSQSCEVTTQRPSLLPHIPPEITLLSSPHIAQGVTFLLPNSTTTLRLNNPIQNYLYDPNSESTIISGDASLFLDTNESPLQSIPLRDFGDQLGQVLNTFLFASTWNSTAYLAGALFENMVANPVGGNNASLILATSVDLTAMIQNLTAAFTVPAIVTTFSKIYECSYPWPTFLILSTLVIFFVAVIAVVFSKKTSIPEYLGYVSGLARESPWIRMPDFSVNVNGMDKARLVKDVKVRLGDISNVENESSVGRLAFDRMEETVIFKKGK